MVQRSCLWKMVALRKASREEVRCDAEGVRDDGQRWIDGGGGAETAGVDDVEVVEVVGLAV